MITQPPITFVTGMIDEEVTGFDSVFQTCPVSSGRTQFTSWNDLELCDLSSWDMETWLCGKNMVIG